MKKSTKGKNKKLGIDYDEIKTKYVMTGLSLRQLAEEYGIRVNSLQHYASLHKWSMEKEQYQTKYRSKVKKKLQDEIIENEVEINRKHYELWNELLDIIGEIIKNKERDLKYENKKYNIGKISEIANILQATQGGQRLAAGLIEASKMKELQLGKEKIEIEKQKVEPPTQAHQDTSFIEALKTVGKVVWEQDQEDKKNE